ncbi:MAG: prepilin-type N-terminal cleavage/methylation domain-containing protein [Candidatus Colwellbacteria bacterium]|nr:prepilin-type N-terminal cleavage/methylation domain-containing protein [Candidatus Colwellbacteria bacterium]
MKEFEKGSNQGFTLIEMLVVIIIISFLMGIVLTGTLGFQALARDTRRAGDLRNAQNFLELYLTKCGHYPGDGNCSTAYGTKTWPTLAGIMVSANITTQFPKELSGRNYYYGVSADGLSYTLGAELERDHNVLKDDIDGTSNGVNCGSVTDDKVYCISS